MSQVPPPTNHPKLVPISCNLRIHPVDAMKTRRTNYCTSGILIYKTYLYYTLKITPTGLFNKRAASILTCLNMSALTIIKKIKLDFLGLFLFQFLFSSLLNGYYRMKLHIMIIFLHIFIGDLTFGILYKVAPG